MITLHEQKVKTDWIVSVIKDQIDTDAFLPLPQSIHLFVKICVIYEAGCNLKWQCNTWKDTRVKAFFVIMHTEIIAKRVECSAIKNGLNHDSEIIDFMKALSINDLTKNNKENSKIIYREKSYQMTMRDFLSKKKPEVSKIGNNYPGSENNFLENDQILSLKDQIDKKN